jgi:hypothetical protein
MRLSKWMLTLSSCAALACGLSARLSAAAPEQKADAPKAAASTDSAKPAAAEAKGEKAEKPGKKSKAAKLTKPWSDMTSLTDEQKTQIAEIHRKSLDEIKQVQQRERDAVLALLNEQQKAEYTSMTEKATTEKKMKKSADGAEKAAPEKAG